MKDLDSQQPDGSTPSGRALSWAVHLLTASGAVLAVFALLSLRNGELAEATLCMLLALAVDSVDGTLARAIGVTRHLPQIDGRRMDDMVDYLNFVIVPALFMVEAGSVVSPWIVVMPVLASSVGFSRTDAKTDDDFFLGFPSYWNILAFYLWLLDISPWAGTLWVVALSFAVFVPYKYIYPSKLSNSKLRYGMSYAGLVWALVLAGCVLAPEGRIRLLVVQGSLAYPAAYMLLSFKLGGLQRGARSDGVHA